MGILFLISLNNPIFKKYTTCWVFLAFRHMLYLCICVFVFFVFARLTHGNIIFDTLKQSSFQKYAICWVFPALGNALYLCICVFVFFYLCIFVFARLTPGIIIFDTLEQSSFQKYATCWVFLAPHNMLCICILLLYLSF